VSTNAVLGRVICNLVIGGRRSTTRSAAAAALIAAVRMCGLIKQSKQTVIGARPRYDTGNIQLHSVTAASHYGCSRAMLSGEVLHSVSIYAVEQCVTSLRTEHVRSDGDECRPVR